jgi:hypothetical protein
MAEAFLFVSTGSILIIGVATLGIAIVTLRDARGYVERAERRMEYLREEQARLLLLVHQEVQNLRKELNRELERRLEAYRGEEQRVGAKQLVRQGREGREWELRTRRDAEQRIDELKRELLEIREIQQDREVEQESSSPRSEGSFEDMLGTRELLRGKTLPTEETQGAERTPRPASSPEAVTSEPAEEDKRPRLGMWHPHPDDDISPGTSAGQVRALSDAPVKMFRRHYDRYLENYEGYVKLAERLYRMQDNAEVPSASLAEREWVERLRRVNDGIKRTTARLDILEEFNPELATDDRISRRATIARSHAELERSKRNRSKL